MTLEPSFPQRLLLSGLPSGSVRAIHPASMAKSRSLSFFIILSILPATSLAAMPTCFLPNSTDRNSLADVPPDSALFFPCNQVAPFSMCCRYGDKCLDNGLCESYARATDGSFLRGRESCTDRSWTSIHCLSGLCTNGETATGIKCVYPKHSRNHTQ